MRSGVGNSTGGQTPNCGVGRVLHPRTPASPVLSPPRSSWGLPLCVPSRGANLEEGKEEAGRGGEDHPGERVSGPVNLRVAGRPVKELESE